MCLPLIILPRSTASVPCHPLPNYHQGCPSTSMGRFAWLSLIKSLAMWFLSISLSAQVIYSKVDSTHEKTLTTSPTTRLRSNSATASYPSAASRNGSVENCEISVNPTKVIKLKVGAYRWINVNCSCCSLSADPFHGKGIFTIRVYTTNKVVATPTAERHHFFHRPYLEDCDVGPVCGAHTYLPNMHTGFYVGSNQIGRIQFIVELSWWNTSHQSYIFDRRKSRHLTGVTGISTAKVHVSTLRHRKAVDFGFEVAVTFIACMTALSAGCMTEVSFLRRNVRRPKALLLALFCQHFIMPGMIFAVLVAVGISAESSFGLFAAAAVPGGGLAHLTVYLMDGDRELSTAISFANGILALVLAPVWLFAFSWQFTIQVHYGFFILWMLPTLGSFLVGFILRHYKPPAADAVMTWFTRPLLLLSGILLSTLGVYINHYAFDYIDYRLVLMALFLVFGGFLIGGIVGIIGRVGKPRRKTLAAETSVFNCLLVIVALRNSLPQPTADLASSAPLWGCFFTPAPIILYFISHKIKAWTLNFIEKRKEKQYRHYSIVSSFAKMAEEVTAVSAPLALDGPSSETPQPPRRSDCDQKVTSL